VLVELAHAGFAACGLMAALYGEICNFVDRRWDFIFPPGFCTPSSQGQSRRLRHRTGGGKGRISVKLGSLAAIGPSFRALADKFLLALLARDPSLLPNLNPLSSLSASAARRLWSWTAAVGAMSRLVRVSLKQHSSVQDIYANSLDDYQGIERPDKPSRSCWLLIMI